MAAVAALVLVFEAVGIVLLHIFLSMVVDEQQMSMAGLKPGSMSTSTIVAGSFLGAFLVLCALLLVRTAIRDKAPTGLIRILLISAAVLHGVLGAVTVGLVGWDAFLFMVVVMGLIVWCLVSYSVDDPPATETSPATGEPHPEPSAA